MGERFDLVQAGGGNTSFKDEKGKLHVKISGIRLSDVKNETHFAILDNFKLLELFEHTNWAQLTKKEREIKASQIVKECNFTVERKPSIETLLHSICPDVVLHAHPICILKSFSSKENIDKFQEEFAFVSYSTPGIELTLELNQSRKNFIEQYKREPESIVLLNHGIVVYDKTPDLAFKKLLNSVNLIYTKLNLLQDEAYSLCNFISDQLESILNEPKVTIFAGKVKNLEVEFSPFFPDAVVFLGAGPLKTSVDTFQKDLEIYISQYKIVPKVFLIEESVYISANTFAKAREIQEVWELQREILERPLSKIEFLSESEIHYLSHWEAENYRLEV